MTYAAALDASAIVWIATAFTQEHRKALDWLNDNSAGDVAFYGVQIELWQIDESKPAIRFNVVSRPAGANSKAAVARASEGLTEAKKLQFDFWSDFSDELTKTGALPSVHSPRPQYWYNVALGRSGFHLSNTANTSENKIGIRVYLCGKYGGEQALNQLMAERDDRTRYRGSTSVESERNGARQGCPATTGRRCYPSLALPTMVPFQNIQNFPHTVLLVCQYDLLVSKKARTAELGLKGVGS